MHVCGAEELSDVSPEELRLEYYKEQGLMGKDGGEDGTQEAAGLADVLGSLAVAVGGEEGLRRVLQAGQGGPKGAVEGEEEEVRRLRAFFEARGKSSQDAEASARSALMFAVDRLAMWKTLSRMYALAEAADGGKREEQIPEAGAGEPIFERAVKGLMVELPATIRSTWRPGLSGAYLLGVGWVSKPSQPFRPMASSRACCLCVQAPQPTPSPAHCQRQLRC
jgi:hypothetical protein